MTARNLPCNERGAKASKAAGRERCLLTVCRGCCCGTFAQHPDIDHAAQLQTLRGDAGSHRAEVRVSDCLDVCEHSNVIVVSPTTTGRRYGGRPTWLGEVLDADATRAVLDWVNDGGPGIADLPEDLLPHVFTPARRVRQSGPA